jgi:hypothetical protein
LDEQPETALPFCEQAVALEPEGMSRDSRGLVYAELGRLQEAQGDFEAFLNWLQRGPPADYERYAPLRRSWLQALSVGRNPFDRTTLDALRSE